MTGCAPLEGTSLVSLYPDAVDGPEGAAALWMAQGDGLRWQSLRELSRLRIELLDHDGVQERCRAAERGMACLTGCVDYVPQDAWDTTESYPLAVIEAGDRELSSIMHEAGHLLHRHEHGAWDYGHCSAYFAALGVECRPELVPRVTGQQ